MKRRDVIKLGAAAVAAVLSGGSSRAQGRPLRVLILGGTGFIGPHMVEALRARGHALTLFNNDRRSAELFPDLESLFGDRANNVEALKNREWDVVIDNSGYVPAHVQLTADLLKDRVQQYLFISTVSVYADRTKDVDESSPLIELKEPTTQEVRADTYGGLKVLCERAVRNVYGSRSTILRPTYIVGPGDSTDRFTYWPVRVSRGGEMLAPGKPGDPIQFIDVRDLAAFTRDCVEQQRPGIYNICNEPDAVSIGQLLEVSRKVTKANTRFVWVRAEFLDEHLGLPSPELPIWTSPIGGQRGRAALKPDRAVANGLRFQSLNTTVRDTLAWHAKRPAKERSKLKAGLTPERERELLQKWKAARKAAA